MFFFSQLNIKKKKKIKKNEGFEIRRGIRRELQ